MKRHTSLQPLSRDHHGALILARLLQKDAPDYKGLPTDIPGKIIYAQEFYAEDLVQHFQEEEEVLKLVTGTSDQLDAMIATIFAEHEKLHGLFAGIVNNPDISVHLDSIGRELEMHIRKEERELFPLIEETCDERTMVRIGEYLSSH